jgi:uncharacterized cofD-like protein
MNIVGIGGGTGLPVLLRGLKQVRDRAADGAGEDRISATAVVCVSDDGGSSGSLREAFGIPAVGDLRNCLVALSGGNPALREIFQYRLSGAAGLDGHSIGNLIVAALRARAGNLRLAVHLAAEFLGLKGRVLPCTEASAHLCAEFQDGAIVRGETRIAARRMRIRRVWLEPSDTQPTSGVLETIASADAIVLGPGSLHTSIIPNLLPAGIADAVRDSRALKIMICNLMTQPGETDCYTASDHVRALQDYLGSGGVQICLLNSRPIPAENLARCAMDDSAAVPNDEFAIADLGVAPISLDLLDESEKEIRHDSLNLARCVVALTRAFERARDFRFGDLRCLSTVGLPEGAPAAKLAVAP